MRGDSERKHIVSFLPDVRADQSPHQTGMTIRMLTQVTVQPDETAIFVKEGKVAGTLPQGRSTLDGSLIPFLSDIVDWGIQFKTIPSRPAFESYAAGLHQRPGVQAGKGNRRRADAGEGLATNTSGPFSQAGIRPMIWQISHPP